MSDDDDNVIDIDAEEVHPGETPTQRGRRRRRERQRKAKTGNSETPRSRVLWIVVGSVLAVVSIRLFDRYFPKPAAIAALPPGAVVAPVAVATDAAEVM